MIKVSQSVEVYERYDKEVPVGTNCSIRVESHWNINRRVILVISGERLTVIGSDLITAIQNAMNSNPYSY